MHNLYKFDEQNFTEKQKVCWTTQQF